MNITALPSLPEPLPNPSPSAPAAPPRPAPPLFVRLCPFAVFAILFWFAEISLQYFWFSKDDAPMSFLRGSAFAGATLISLALFTSAIFKWFPRLAQYWRIRRYLGVSGFIFILFHVWSAYHFLFDYDLATIYFSLNPIKNPLVFGSIAFIILFIMAATSTDWAMQKLTPKRWKFIHRFVYLAFLASILHFMVMNPAMLTTAPGFLLLATTVLAVFGQIFWFFKIASLGKFRTKGSVIGFSLMALAAILGYAMYVEYFSRVR